MASDDCIDVAWPVLSQSERLDTETLIACAKSKSQQHLLAISKRQTVPEAVTDVLVVRGSPEVVTSVASNAGANLSKSGFLHLVRRSEGDFDSLLKLVGLRKDIPRHLFHQLIAKASEEVRQKLKKERPDIETSGPSCRRRCHRGHSRQVWPGIEGLLYGETYGGKTARERRIDGRQGLRACSLSQVQRDDRCPVVALRVSNDVAERALIEKDREPVLILAKSLDFSWPTTMALLFLGAANFRITVGELDQLKIDFHRLNVKACREVVTIYRTRKEEVFGGSFQQPRRMI